MKIVEVSVYPARAQKHTKGSGVASYAKNLCKQLPLGPGDELYVVCERLGGAAETYREDGFTIVRAFRRGHHFVRDIARQVRRINPNVVHLQQEVALYGGLHTAFLFSWLLRALRRYHTVVTLHHVVDVGRIDRDFVRSNNSRLPTWVVRQAFLAIYRPIVRRAQRIIVHEQYFKDILVSQYGAQPAAVCVVQHGVEDFTALPQAAARRQLDIPRDRHVALSMGYLAGYKGFDLLLEGFAAYAATDPQAFLLIGAGLHPKLENDPEYLRLYEAMQHKARALIPARQYRWTGFVAEQDIAAYYSACDVALFPYTIAMSSSGPMAIAIGYEKPFLGSDVYAAVLPARVLFPRTPAAMAAKLQQFFADQPAYQSLSRRLKQERLWRTTGTKTMRIYKDCQA